MATRGNKAGRAQIEAMLTAWIEAYQQLRIGDSSWSYRSFGDLLAAHGQFFFPDRWPSATPHPRRARQCFHAANEWADRNGWTYVEGLVYVPAAAPHEIVDDHAWCLTADGSVADPALPDGAAAGYIGIPITAEFRHNQRRARGTDAVFTADPANPFAGHVNEAILRHGLPADAVAAPLPNSRKSRE
ncbi:hypothetical protein [Nocardia niwae]|uniref:hypothetical protein n=1 Tax=Nocardia niwae TaxID=626084 RepID=UPI0033DACB25